MKMVRTCPHLTAVSFVLMVRILNSMTQASVEHISTGGGGKKLRDVVVVAACSGPGRLGVTQSRVTRVRTDGPRRAVTLPLWARSIMHVCQTSVLALHGCCARLPGPA